MKFLLTFSIVAGLLFCGSQRVLAAKAPVKPCDVVTKQAAEKLYGGALDPASGIVGTCVYFGPNKDDKKGILVTYFPAGTLGTGTMVDAAYDGMVKDDPKAKVTPVGGLGDKANFIASDGNTIMLMVLYHNSIVGLGATNSPNPRIKDDLVQAVRQILQGL